MISLAAKTWNAAFSKRHGQHKPAPLPPAIASLADSVAYRLETPRLKVWKGEDGKTRSQAKNAGFVDRRLSPSYKEEVASACIQALAASGELECVTRCGILFRPNFQASIIPAFSLARQALEMGESSHTRRLASFSLDAHLGTEFDLAPQDAVMIRASLEEGKRRLSRGESKHNPRRSQLAKLFRQLRHLATIARDLDSSRKSKSNYRTARALIRFACQAANGGSLGDWRERSKSDRSMAVSRLVIYLKPAIRHLANQGEQGEQGEQSATNPRLANLESLPLGEAMALLF